MGGQEKKGSFASAPTGRSHSSVWTWLYLHTQSNLDLEIVAHPEQANTYSTQSRWRDHLDNDGKLRSIHPLLRRQTCVCVVFLALQCEQKPRYHSFLVHQLMVHRIQIHLSSRSVCKSHLLRNHNRRYAFLFLSSHINLITGG